MTPPPAPTLLVFGGLMGVGKSALSCTVGRRLCWLVVDKDDFSDILMAQVEPYGPLAYENMFAVAESLLAQGFSVICDSPLRGEVGYLTAEKLAQGNRVRLRIVACSLSDETLWKARLETRERRSAHILKTWDDLLRYRTQAEADFSYETSSLMLELDMAAPLGKRTENVIGWLDAQKGKL